MVPAPSQLLAQLSAAAARSMHEEQEELGKVRRYEIPYGPQIMKFVCASAYHG